MGWAVAVFAFPWGVCCGAQRSTFSCSQSPLPSWPLHGGLTARCVTAHLSFDGQGWERFLPGLFCSTFGSVGLTFSLRWWTVLWELKGARLRCSGETLHCSHRKRRFPGRHPGGLVIQGPWEGHTQGVCLSQVLKNVEMNLEHRAFQSDYFETFLGNCIS